LVRVRTWGANALKMRIRILSLGVIIIFLLFSGSSSAQIFKWTDEKGSVYFSDDISKVPEKYRSSIESKSQGSGVYELEGFSGINWGIDLSTLSDMVPSGTDSGSNEISAYLRNGDELTIGVLFMVSKTMGKEIDLDRRDKIKEGVKKGF
jgi:hypothetical protein